jgi:allantoinase
MAQAFAGRRVATGEGVREAAVLVRGEKIAGVCAPGEVPAEYEVIDLGSHVLLPGLVDAHVHINEPGRADWEGFATATRAAAAGGFTTLVDMPLNCLPATTMVAALEAKRTAARGLCMVDWAAWGGVSEGNVAHLLPLARAGVRGFKCFLSDPGIEGFARAEEAELREAAAVIRETGLPLLVHAELPSAIAAALPTLAGADWSRYSTWLASRPDEAEVEAIALLLELCREYGFRLHIVHLATAKALDLLRNARAEGLPVTVETCPHYLYFSAEEIADGSTLHKCAPPIRGRENREALWRALGEGVIDLIGTDHSPCPPEWKRVEEGDFQTAWGGISSLAVALPAVWTGMLERGYGVAELARWMAANPAQLAGLDASKGAIATGMDADLVVFDPDAEFEVTLESLHTRHRVSLYVGERLRGRVIATYLRGREVYRDGRFAERAEGREVV